MPQPSPYIRLYDRVVLGHPRLVVLALLLVFAFLGYQIKDFRLDASADSLILEHDRDLKYSRIIAERYHTGEFLLLTYTPRADLFAPESLANLKNLREKLRQLPRVDSVVSILDVPLLANPLAPLKELRGNIKHLEDSGVDVNLARKELKESPLFQNLLVSPDLRSTALQINLTPDPTYEQLQKRKTALRDKEYEGAITPEERLELEQVVKQYHQRQELLNDQRHEDIGRVRAIMERYRDNAELFLGGVPMISDDMVTFVKKDLKLFGLGMFIFLVLMLGMLFKRKRWVLLPLLCCIFAAVCMMGALALFGWQVTVISSNFISLQLIITMSLTIHLIVRYGEIQAERTVTGKRQEVIEMVRTIFKPCLYTSTTTIAGFCSLIMCDILPVINFGWMMTTGICVSFTVVFLFFPASLMLLPETHPKARRRFGLSLTSHFADFTKSHPAIIYGSTAVLAVLTFGGMTRLAVENSFIDYFRKSTEIYQGMKMIDRNLGGTTPLDVIIDLGEPAKPAAPAVGGDDLFGEFQEFEAAEQDEKYWYTSSRLELVEKVHDYLDSLPATGKVLSLSTVTKVMRQLYGDRSLDNFGVTLLFNQLPEDFKKIILNPYVSIPDNQIRLSVRIKDSLEHLKRDALLRQIQTDLVEKLGLKPEQVHLTGVMVLYNNMLQSLFRSQISTIGFTVLALMAMFLVLFRSLKVSLIAIFPNLLASIVVLGVMGLANIPLDMMTITIVAISIGIAVDNTIHYIHRFRREFPLDGNYISTMFRCHGTIGNAMYYTSITITVGFSILVFSNFIPSVLFGLLTGLAMVMAMLAALTLLPRLIIFFKPFGPETQLEG